jgi:hypothetical protein
MATREINCTVTAGPRDKAKAKVIAAWTGGGRGPLEFTMLIMDGYGQPGATVVLDAEQAAELAFVLCTESDVAARLKAGEEGEAH